MYKNYQQIALSPLRREALGILRLAIDEVNPSRLMERQVRYDKEFNSVIVNNNAFDLLTGRIFVIGGGKAAGAMAEAFERIVGPENIAAGAVNSQGRYRTKKIKLFPAGHPLTDRAGIEGVRAMLRLKTDFGISQKDLVVCLISGGGSAMVESPVPAVSFQDFKAINEILIKSGAPIRDINIVRKHMSEVKGGLLAANFFPAQVVGVVLSDVVGNDLGTIASGPTAPDFSTFADAIDVVKKYGLERKLPASLLAYLEAGLSGHAPETPKNLERTQNYIIGDSVKALEAMSFIAKKKGLRPIILSSKITGDPEEAAGEIVEEIKEELEAGEYNAFIFGGETSPGVKEKKGRGGRNTHLAAITLLKAEALPGEWVFASLASDGIDSAEESAGAIVDNQTLAIARRRGIDLEQAILEFDSLPALADIGGTIIETGRTGTNVGDLMLFIYKDPDAKNA